MGTRHPNPNLVKLHLTHSVDELARTLKVSKGTVRRWLKTGLDAVDAPGLTIVRGSEVRRFLRQRRASAKRPCGPGFLFCLRCREPREPADLKADLVYPGEHAAAACLRGPCPECSTLMYRRVNVARLDTVRGRLIVSFPEAHSRLRGIPCSSLNDDFAER